MTELPKPLYKEKHISYTILIDGVQIPANIRIRKTQMKKKPKGRPKKKKTEILVNLNVRVPQDVKKIADKWGKRKGEKIAAAIRAEKAKEE